MKNLTLGLCSLLALGVPALWAQDLAGQWQGTLKAGNRELRIVVKVANGANGVLSATMYSIDQAAGTPVPASSASFQGGTFRFAVQQANATYEGRLSADGNSINGTFTQGQPLPLNFVRATQPTAWEIPPPPAPPKPMAADARMAFEVATIKPSNPDTPGKAFTFRGRQFVTINTTLSDMIVMAYGIHAKQIVGAPSWVESEKFDITALPEAEGQPSETQIKTMLQGLIRERFHFEFHRDRRELNVYAITVDRSGAGHKLTPSENQGQLPGLLFRGLGNLPAQNATMKDFAGVMQSTVLDRPVIDQTGIEGRYNFTLVWTPDEFQFAGLGARPAPRNDAPNAPPDLFTAMREQLGLRLESTKAPAEVFVVDKVDKPTEN